MMAVEIVLTSIYYFLNLFFNYSWSTVVSGSAAQARLPPPLPQEALELKDSLWCQGPFLPTKPGNFFSLTLVRGR